MDLPFKHMLAGIGTVKLLVTEYKPIKYSSILKFI